MVTTMMQGTGLKSEQLPIIEIFGPTIQGEGAIAGKVSHFVRTGGCGYKCVWCDSMHAVDAEQVKKNRTMMHASEICDRLLRFNRAEYVTITGGDPVMWDLGLLINHLQAANFKVTVETQGQLWKTWLTKCDQVTVSPKPPSSGMTGKMKMDVLNKYWSLLGRKMSMKIVVFDDADFEFVRYMRKEFPNVDLYISAGTPQRIIDKTQLVTVEMQAEYDQAIKHDILTRMDWLTAKVFKSPDLFNVTVFPQMHVLIWGTKLGV
jgi:7-carboxy-7-deazaguanine synthase